MTVRIVIERQATPFASLSMQDQATSLTEMKPPEKRGKAYSSLMPADKAGSR
jgi:hypothetical protein